MTNFQSRLGGAAIPLSLVALSAAMPLQAQAQAQGVPPTPLDPEAHASIADKTAQDDGTGADIVVNGSYARSLAAATERKRDAGYGVDTIAATDIGKFPAQNVAEALQLIPGVTITRPRGEGL